MDSAIETHALRRKFGDVIAVDGLDLVVEKGTFFGFLGPNGAGKSTTIKMLTGLLGPSAGSARILGHDVVADSVAAKKVMGLQDDTRKLLVDYSHGMRKKLSISPPRSSTNPEFSSSTSRSRALMPSPRSSYGRSSTSS